MYELKRISTSNRLKATKIPISVQIKITKHRLRYIENQGKMIQNPSTSPKTHFDSLVADYKSERGACENCLNDLEVAQNKLKEYEQKSFVQKARHPIKNFIGREHKRLKNEVKTKAKALDHAKSRLKAKEHAIKNESRTIKTQVQHIRDFNKAKKLYKTFTDPNNQKYLNVFPNDKVRIEAWWQNINQNFNNSTFSVSNVNGVPKYNELANPSGSEFKMLSDLATKCEQSKIIAKQRQAINALKMPFIGKNSKDTSRDDRD